MTAVPTEWDEQDLLASDHFAEPLVARGVRCHGGFDEDGTYVSPRTLYRVPAIAAWQAQHAEQFDRPLLDIELSAWPEHYPNLAQSRYLLAEGVTEPIVAILTRIGTVEGFGAMLRHSVVPDLTRAFVEDVRGTAMAHLDRGLYEAHARDEAGFGGEGGHEHMWYVARDIAFEDPVTSDQRALMLERMGIAGPGGAAPAPPSRAVDDLDPVVEQLIARMMSLLLIEISAFHTFAWAEELLADPDLVAGDGDAARMVSHICADETPHVEYLKTVLSEMRDRTFVGESGRRLPGVDVIGALWERARAQSLGPRRADNLRATRREVEHTLAARARGADVLAYFEELGSVTVSSN